MSIKTQNLTERNDAFFDGETYVGSVWQPLNKSHRPIFGIWFAGRVGYPISSGPGRDDFPTREAAIKALIHSIK